jgi:hypothetical protein
LGELLALSQEAFDGLATSLREAQGSKSQRALAKALASRTHLDEEKVYAYVRLLGMLLRVREQMELSGEEFLAAVERAALRTDKANLSPPAVEWEAGKRRLGALLDGSLGLATTAKATDLLFEHANVICSARILSDLRPIFGSDVAQDPTALLVIHQLRVQYHKNGQIEEMFFAMDAKDLADLQAALERAEKKAATLKSIAKRAGVPVLETTLHGDSQ